VTDESALQREKPSGAPTGRPSREDKWLALLLIPGAVFLNEAVNFVVLLVTLLIVTALPGVPVDGGWGRCAGWALWIILLRAPQELVFLVLVSGPKVMQLIAGKNPTKPLNSRGGRLLGDIVDLAFTALAAGIVFGTQLTAMPKAIGMTAVAAVAVFLAWRLFTRGERRRSTR
jgi:hypothetical protein